MEQSFKTKLTGYTYLFQTDNRDKKDCLSENVVTNGFDRYSRVTNLGIIIREQDGKFFHLPFAKCIDELPKLKRNERIFHEVIGFGWRKFALDVDGSLDKVDNIKIDFNDIQLLYNEYPNETEEETLEKLNAISIQNARRIKIINEYTVEKRREIIYAYVSVKIERALINYFNEIGVPISNNDIVIMDASDKTKYSRHYVVHNYCVESHEAAKKIYEDLAKYLPADIYDIIDKQVYTSVHNLRMALCCKRTTDGHYVRPLNIVSDHKFSDTLITFVNGCEMIDIELPIKPVIAESKISSEVEKKVIDMIAPYTYGLKFNGIQNGIFTFRRFQSSFCEICGRTHDHDNTMFAIVNNGNVYLKCNHAKKSESLYIGKVEGFNNANIIEEKLIHNFDEHKYNAENVIPYNLLSNKLTIVKSGMGTSKTKMMMEELVRLNPEIIIWVTFRRSLADKMSTELKTAFPDMMDYRYVNKGNITDKLVIIQLDSLHRLFLKDFANYKSILVLDEIESILTQTESELLHKSGRLARVMTELEYLLKHSTNVIALDADVNKRTFELFKTISEIRKQPVKYFNNEFKSGTGKTVYDYVNINSHDNDLMLAIKDCINNPLTYATDSKAKADTVELLAKTLMPTAVIKKYTSDTTEEQRKDLQNVNETWNNVDILIYTSTITAGISYENKRFTKVFGYFTGERDYQICIQMLGRIRDAKTYLIYMDTPIWYLPEDIPSIEKIIYNIHYAKSIYDIDSSHVAYRRFKTIDGEFKPQQKDLFYWIHMFNLQHMNKSKNNFKHYFIKTLENAGCKITTVNSVPDKQNKIKDIIKQFKEDAKTLVAEQIIDGAPKDALPLELAKDDEPPTNYKQRDDLVKLYHVNAESINVKFVKTYNNETMKQKFKFLTIASSTANINQWEKEIAALTGEAIPDDKEYKIDDLVVYYKEFHEKMKDKNKNEIKRMTSKKDEYVYKLCTAMDILNSVFELGDATRYYLFTGLATIEYDDLDNRIGSWFMGKQKDLDTIKYLFKINSKTNDSSTFKSRLQFINVIINSVFDLTIARRNHKRTCTEYYLTPMEHFKYIDDKVVPFISE